MKVYKVEVVAPIANTLIFYRALTDNGIVNGPSAGVPRDFASVFLVVAMNSSMQLNSTRDVFKITVEFEPTPAHLPPLPLAPWWGPFTP